MSLPFFSIIIPVYNKGLYFQQCIDSICAQTFNNFEVLVVNDGSTDNTPSILNHIIDPRFRIFTTSNGGVSKARNIGLNNAIGEYILFIDADDYIDKDYCQTIYKAIKEFNADLLIFGLTKIYKDSSKKALYPQRNGIIDYNEFYDSFLSEFEQREGIYGYISNKAIKRSFITNHQLSFNCSLKLAEDLDFWISVYALKARTAFLQYAGYNYIQNTLGSSIFFKYDPEPNIRIWLRIYDLLSPCSTTNLHIIQKKVWGTWSASLLESDEISIKNIKQFIDKTTCLKDNYTFIAKYQPTTFLSRQIKYKRAFNIYLYLQLRHLYHVVRLWLK